MNTAERIRERRTELLLSEAMLADELGLSLESYGDLEQHQDELATCVTLEQATQLAAGLDIPLLELLSEAKPSSAMPSPAQVAERIALHLARTSGSVASLEDAVGWGLRAFLAEPLPLARRQPIMFFQAIAQALRVPPLSLVPYLHVA